MIKKKNTSSNSSEEKRSSPSKSSISSFPFYLDNNERLSENSPKKKLKKGTVRTAVICWIQSSASSSDLNRKIQVFTCEKKVRNSPYSSLFVSFVTGWITASFSFLFYLLFIYSSLHIIIYLLLLLLNFIYLLLLLLLFLLLSLLLLLLLLLLFSILD